MDWQTFLARYGLFFFFFHFLIFRYVLTDAATCTPVPHHQVLTKQLAPEAISPHLHASFKDKLLLKTFTNYDPFKHKEEESNQRGSRRKGGSVKAYFSANLSSVQLSLCCSLHNKHCLHSAVQTDSFIYWANLWGQASAIVFTACIVYMVKLKCPYINHKPI